MGRKGIALIIAIFFILILSVLGWALVSLQSTDFSANLRIVDSERALYLAEAGSEWALRQLTNDVNWHTSSTLHRFSFGEYNVVCRDPQEGEEADAVIEVTGFVPSEENFRARRIVKLLVRIGSLDKAVQVKNLFDWHRMQTGSWIDGDISAGHYNGDGDEVFDEVGEDYDPLPPPVMPPDGSGDERDFIVQGSYPEIDMDYFQRHASIVWTGARETTASAFSGGNVLWVSQWGFFTGMENEVVRNLTHGSWNDSNWAVVVNVGFGGRRAQLDRFIGDTWDNDTIRIVKRFTPRWYVNRRWYIKGNASGTIPGDVVIDVRNNSFTFFFSSIVATGDIVIKGGRRIRFFSLLGWPNLATKEGDILSLDTPLNNNSNSRSFYGLIYTQNGNVDFNYLNSRGGVMGNNVSLEGEVKIRYNPWFIPVNGFIFSPSVVNWQEE